jgi:ABC-type glycerol-3-phosphate transport system substrate-binding protein
MLLQRHINLIDDYNRIYLAEAKMAQTVAFYAQLVAGERKIAGQSASTEGAASKDLNEGDICAYITPDWRVKTLKDYTETDPVTKRKKLEGKMRMMPLPIFEPGDARTATWGGTMMGIPRTCPRPKDAWKLIELFYFSEEGLRARLRETNILPPVVEQWNDAVYQRADPYFGGQQVDKLFVELAHEIPSRYVTPATTFASTTLSAVMDRARAYVEDHGSEGLEEKCRAWLKDAAEDLERRIRHGKFEE